MLDVVRSMMCKSDLSISFWGYTFEIVVVLLNRVPSKYVYETQYEI